MVAVLLPTPEEQDAACRLLQRFFRSRKAKRAFEMLTSKETIQRLKDMFLDPKALAAGAADSELYTIGMLSARDALRTDPLVIAALDDAWSAATAAAGSSGGDAIDFDGYMALSRKLYLACFAENSDSKIDPNEFRSGAEDEWLVDSADTPGYLSKDAFMKSWFELADVHTESVDANEYATWLRRITNKCIYISGSGSGKVAWRTDAQLLDAVRDAAHLTKKKFEPRRKRWEEAAELFDWDGMGKPPPPQPDLNAAPAPAPVRRVKPPAAAPAVPRPMPPAAAPSFATPSSGALTLGSTHNWPRLNTEVGPDGKRRMSVANLNPAAVSTPAWMRRRSSAMLMAPAHAAIAEVLETVDMRPPSPADSLSSRAPTPPPPPPPEVDLEALFGEEEDDEALAPAATFSPLKHSRAQDWDEVYDYSNDGQVPAALPPVVRPEAAKSGINRSRRPSKDDACCIAPSPAMTVLTSSTYESSQFTTLAPSPATLPPTYSQPVLAPAALSPMPESPQKQPQPPRRPTSPIFALSPSHEHPADFLAPNNTPLNSNIPTRPSTSPEGQRHGQAPWHVASGGPQKVEVIVPGVSPRRKLVLPPQRRPPAVQVEVQLPPPAPRAVYSSSPGKYSQLDILSNHLKEQMLAPAPPPELQREVLRLKSANDALPPPPPPVEVPFSPQPHHYYRDPTTTTTLAPRSASPQPPPQQQLIKKPSPPPYSGRPMSGALRPCLGVTGRLTSPREADSALHAFAEASIVPHAQLGAVYYSPTVTCGVQTPRSSRAKTRPRSMPPVAPVSYSSITPPEQHNSQWSSYSPRAVTGAPPASQSPDKLRRKSLPAPTGQLAPADFSETRPGRLPPWTARVGSLAPRPHQGSLSARAPSKPEPPRSPPRPWTAAADEELSGW